MSKLNKLKLWYYIGTVICFLFICWLILFGEINRYCFFIIFIGWILIGYCRGYCKGRSDEMLAHNKVIESVLEEYLQKYKTERGEQIAQEIRENMHHVD